ncbi:MAG: hypothetical protein HKN26_14240 [Acidimicrobiales bacterium]|nr:hypothetical protein [Acidimicrobiales bacterium]
MRTVRLRLAVAAVLTLLLVAASLGSAAQASSTTSRAMATPAACEGLSTVDTAATNRGREERPAPHGLTKRCLRLNQIQVMGTHNSYKLDTTPEILDALAFLDPALASELEYRHVPLAEQFDQQGIRQIELDVFADPEGGLFSQRVALDALDLPNETPPELLEPGMKVMHVQEVDFNTSCLTLVLCLEQVEAWSDAHPRHLPIAVLVELKQAAIPDPLNLGFVTPLPFGTTELDALDAEIRSVFGRHDLITPDDVRGDYATLEDAVLAGHWPNLSRARGKVILLMDNSGTVRDLYRADRPSLEGRPIFTNGVPGEADAAFVKVNEPRGNEAYIQDLVAAGYVVRTRADSPTNEARSGDTTRFEAAIESGAQWISTDYPVPGRSEFSDYVAQLTDGHPAVCNPVNTGPRCVNANLERLR